MSAEPHISRNQRRLALRNANLRPPLIQRNVTPKSDQPSSSILVEINNASLRRQRHQRQMVNDTFEIYQDSHPSTKSGTFHHGLSDDKENALSPEGVRLSTPSPVPPITSHLSVSRTRSSKSSKSQSASGGYRMHIEHLEAQLVAAHRQLEDYSSPKTKKAHLAKRRELSQECELLRQQLCDVEERCQRRIDEEAEQYQCGIKRLERELEISEQRRMEAEYDLEETKRTLRSVQASHIELERRLDSWSELLARSPTKDEVPTPAHTRPRLGPRPRSMFPRIPTGNLEETSPPKAMTPFTPTLPKKPTSPVRRPFDQVPFLPRQSTMDQSSYSPRPKSPLPEPGSLSIRRRRQLRREGLAEGHEEKITPDKPLSDELGLLGLGDIFTKHSQTTTISSQSSPSQNAGHASMSSQSGSPGSPLAYKSDQPPNKAPRVMRRFVNTAGGPRPLVLSATLRSDQRANETPRPSPYILLQVLSRLSRRIWEGCSASLDAARWCVALFLLGPLAWRRVMAGPSMFNGS